jgi:hypothetical protein
MLSEREIIQRLKEIGLVKGYHYDFASHPERCLWTAHYSVAVKIAEVLGEWDGYNVDFAGGYYYWTIAEHH